MSPSATGSKEDPVNTFDPVVVTAMTVIAVTAIAGVTAVLTALIAIRDTPGSRRAEIIDALARLIRAVRNRR